MSVNAQRLSAAGFDAALPRLLASPGERAASPQVVAAFHRYIATCGIDWLGLTLREGDRTLAAALLMLPGRTGFLLLEEYAQSLRAAGTALVGALLADARVPPLHYVQALIEPDAHSRATVLRGSGLTELTQLDYLERAVRLPVLIAPDPPELAWQSFGPRTAEVFKALITETYTDSLDCPELTALRPIDDVIAAHQASGVFLPELWQLAELAGEAAACMLLAPLPGVPVGELVYMGVAPRARRRGLGRVLLRRCLELCRAQRLDRLSVVVDLRNAPARALYHGVGLRGQTQRRVFLGTRAVHPSSDVRGAVP